MKNQYYWDINVCFQVNHWSIATETYWPNFWMKTEFSILFLIFYLFIMACVFMHFKESWVDRNEITDAGWLIVNVQRNVTWCDTLWWQVKTPHLDIMVSLNTLSQKIKKIFNSEKIHKNGTSETRNITLSLETPTFLSSKWSFQDFIDETKLHTSFQVDIDVSKTWTPS